MALNVICPREPTPTVPMTARPGTPPAIELPAQMLRFEDGDATRPVWVGQQLAPMQLDWDDTPAEPDVELVWVGSYRAGAHVALAARPAPVSWWRRLLTWFAQVIGHDDRH